ncbi:DNA-binding protein [Listeria sp. SHR_NRA_18]|uniref:helix-turn-helix domain-containing protein n=1 Tax=Listeria TaxID=1637 RepID=UPI00066A005D|nr:MULTISPECIES: DNA-binding protein [Listeria]KMT62530.1 hypothetical protein X559_1068 [Listeria newyorkensis]RQW65984.1 DNA-binding protein [Listeria sp. SHR_NRA_18]
MEVRLAVEDRNILSELLAQVAEKAYMHGVEDAKKYYQYPEALKTTDIEKMYQIKSAKVSELVRRRDFPKIKLIRARYPRDEVIEFMKNNKHLYAEKDKEVKEKCSQC